LAKIVSIIGCVLIAAGVGNAHIISAKSEDFLIDTTISYYSVKAGEGYPQAAFDGHCYTLVWERDGNIIVGRLTQAGVVIDTNGIIIKKSTQCYQPVIAYGDSTYLIVWSDGLGYNSNQIFGRIIKKDAYTYYIDSIDIHLYPSIVNQGSPCVAYDGNNFLVVWVEDRSLKAIRIGQHGDIVDATPIVIVDDYEQIPKCPAVTFDGVNYLVVWNWGTSIYEEDRSIMGCRITPSGVILPPNEFLISRFCYFDDKVSVASGGGVSLAIWVYDFNVYGARIDTCGLVLDTTRITISASPTCNEINPAISYDGMNFAVIWQDRRNGPYYDLYGTRFSTSGMDLDGGVPINGDATTHWDPCIVFGDSAYLIAWEASSYLRGCVMPANLLPGSYGSFPVAQYFDTIANDQSLPAVAFVGSSYAAVWKDYCGKDGIRVSVFDTLGMIEQTATVDTDSYQPFYGTKPFTSSMDGYGLVFWGNRYLRITDYDLYCDTIATYPAGLSPFLFFQDICGGNNRWLRVWRDEFMWTGFYETNTYCRFVDSSGQPTGNVYTVDSIGDSYTYQQSLAMAFDGTKYFCLLDHDDAILGRFMYDANDSLGAKFGLTSVDHGQLKMAFGGLNYLVVYDNGGDIYGFRVDPDGVLVDTAAILICCAAGTQSSPVVASNGNKYLVAWEDQRGGLQKDIYGAWVTVGGQTSADFILSDRNGDKTQLAMAKGPGEQMALLWKGDVDSINGKAVDQLRIWGRFIYNTTGVSLDGPDEGVSLNNKLNQNFPNPFSRNTYLSYQVGSVNSSVELNIYNITGQRVKMLVNGRKKKGVYEIKWDGKDEHGNIVAPGVYLYTLRTDEGVSAKKMVVVK
jgi:hypothetical protein